MRHGLLPRMLALLTPAKGAVSLPSTRWLFTGRRSILASACIGGGVCRAILNLALASSQCRSALQTSDVDASLSALAEHPDASPNVHRIANAARAALTPPPSPLVLDLAPTVVAAMAVSTALTAPEHELGSLLMASPRGFEDSGVARGDSPSQIPLSEDSPRTESRSVSDAAAEERDEGATMPDPVLEAGAVRHLSLIHISEPTRPY